MSGSERVPEIEYDETLLAVIGILDEVKHQSNVASWVKADGLWGPHPPPSLANSNTDAPTHEYNAPLSDSGSVDSGRRGEGKKRRRDALTSVLEESMMERSADAGLPCASTNQEWNPSSSGEAPLWFDNPLTMRHWVDQGRNALEALGIPTEHGLKQ